MHEQLTLVQPDVRPAPVEPVVLDRRQREIARRGLQRARQALRRSQAPEAA